MNIYDYDEMTRLNTEFVIFLVKMYHYNSITYELEPVDDIMSNFYILANEKLHEKGEHALETFKKVIPNRTEGNTTYFYEDYTLVDNVKDLIGSLLEANESVLFDDIDVFEELEKSIKGEDQNMIAQLGIMYFYRFSSFRNNDYSL